MGLATMARLGRRALQYLLVVTKGLRPERLA
jgi:hypothetical protein